MKNIVMISVDDLLNVVRFRDAFGPEFVTPNIDRLLAEGFSFDNASAVVPLCRPSRAATMSSKTAFETGIFHNQDGVLFDVVKPEETLTGYFDKKGFYVAGKGKVYHDRITPEDDPDAHPITDVYDEVSPLEGWQGFGNKVRVTGPSIVEEEAHEDSVTAEWAADFLDRYDGADPFLLTVGIYKPHLSWNPPQKYLDLYDLSEIDLEPLKATSRDELPEFYLQYLGGNRNTFNDADWVEFVRGYLASVSFADAKIGEILDALDASEHGDNTSIVLWSDHGFHLGDHDSWKKFSLFESGTSVPFIVVDKDLGGAGQSTDVPVSLLDLMPTMAGIAGLKTPDSASGLDVSGLISGDSIDRDGVIAHAWGSISYRTETHRLNLYHDGQIQLFDCVADPMNDNDLSGDAANAGLIASLLEGLRGEATRLGVTVTEDGAVTLGSGDTETFVVIGDGDVKGGRGDDRYFVTEEATVTEKKKGGTDTIYLTSRGDYVLPDHVENLIDSAVADRRIDGNKLDNYLAGNNGIDQIFGGKGKDTLVGGRHDDLLAGQKGNDTYLYEFNWEFDQIVEKAGEGRDTIQFGRRVLPKDLVFAREGKDLVIHLMNPETAEINSSITIRDQFKNGPRIETVLFHSGQTVDLAQIGTRTSSGNDKTSGSDGDDVIYGLTGQDVIRGQDGRDLLVGGAGNDQLGGGRGGDTLRGGSGSDLLIGGKGPDVYIIEPDEGSTDRIIGFTPGEDKIDLSYLSEAVVADAIHSATNDGRTAVLSFATGGILRVEDVKVGQIDWEKDVILPGVDLDQLGNVVGSEEGETIRAKDLALHIAGLGGDDTLRGSNRADLLLGGDGDDVITANGGNDIVMGGAGADRIDGGKGDDVLLAGDAALGALVDASTDPFLDLSEGEPDILRGGQGNDRLAGDAGTDTLSGGDGDDRLAGATGDDLISTGKGSDVLVFRAGDGDDVVTDFTAGRDRILFQNVTFDDLNFINQGDDRLIFFDGGSILLEGLAGTVFKAGDFDFE